MNYKLRDMFYCYLDNDRNIAKKHLKITDFSEVRVKYYNFINII